MGKRPSLEKKYVIGDRHLNRIKKNIFQKLVNGGKTYFNAFRGGTSKKLIESLYSTNASRRSACFVTYRF